MSTLSKFLRRLRHPRERRSYALDGLDRKLEAYLNFDGGTFIEAGANDGVRQSNTLYFEKYRRWRGLLIEAIPALAAACRKNRPRCIVESTALVPFDYRDATVEMQYCNLMSLVRGAMRSSAEEAEHIRQGCACQAVETYMLRVPATTLTALLDRHGLRDIDLLSLDVEGYELPVLQGLDFDRYQPRWMVIEARYRADVEAFLSPRYEPVAAFPPYDVLYRRRS